MSGHPDLADARAWAESCARASYGRLLALLTARTHDVAAAEDALADAFERALERWPTEGVPRNRDGWLLTVARNRQRDQWRSAAVRTSVPLDVERHARAVGEEQVAIPDRRLALLLVCAHEQISPGLQTPLMLNVVLGYTAEQISGAFAVPASTMASRLVRAKRRIKADRIPFEDPEQGDLWRRLAPVREAVYGAFAIEWPTVGRARHALVLGLGDLLTELAPGDPEVHGLAALMYLSSARLPARTGVDGRFVPLAQQDPQNWNGSMIERGHAHLRAAHKLGVVGRFQLEAAIAAVHCARGPDRPTDWPTLHRLHVALQELAPTLGGTVALAAVTAEIDGPAAGLEVLRAVADGTRRFQPAWSTRAHLLARLGHLDDARTACDRAITLATDPAEREYLALRRAELECPEA